MRIEKITGGNAGTYNAACFYLENRNIIPDEILTSPNGLRYGMFKDGKKIAEYREDLQVLKIYRD